MENALLLVFRVLYRKLGRMRGGSFVAAKLYGLVRRYFRLRPIAVLGHRMFLDEQDSLRLLLHGVYEPLETEIVTRHVHVGSVVLDIGANIGYYTLLLARQVGVRGRVYAFEPDPRNFAILEANVLANGYRNVVLERRAVSDVAGRVQLYLSKHNWGDHRIYPAEEARDTIEVEAILLDDYFEETGGQIDLIKMDIQGAEPAAIHGMRRMLAQGQPQELMAEFWPTGLLQQGVDLRAFLTELRAYGFIVHDIDEEQQVIDPVEDDELLSRYGRSPEYRGTRSRLHTTLLLRRNPLQTFA